MPSLTAPFLRVITGLFLFESIVVVGRFLWKLWAGHSGGGSIPSIISGAGWTQALSTWWWSSPPAGETTLPPLDMFVCLTCSQCVFSYSCKNIRTEAENKERELRRKAKLMIKSD